LYPRLCIHPCMCKLMAVSYHHPITIRYEAKYTVAYRPRVIHYSTRVGVHVLYRCKYCRSAMKNCTSSASRPIAHPIPSPTRPASARPDPRPVVDCGPRGPSAERAPRPERARAVPRRSGPVLRVTIIYPNVYKFNQAIKCTLSLITVLCICTVA
jgi:hypothetical protein